MSREPSSKSNDTLNFSNAPFLHRPIAPPHNLISKQLQIKLQTHNYTGDPRTVLYRSAADT